MNSHKELERFYLLRFRKVCPEFPHGIIEDSESPDFLVNGSDGVVGIELTRVYQPDSIEKNFFLQEIEKERDNIVDRIKIFYLGKGGSPLRVSIAFSGNATEKNGIKDEDLEPIAVLIKEYQPKIGNTVYFPDCLKSKDNFSSWLDRVSISTRDQDEENFLTAQTCAMRQTLYSADVRKVIKKKEKKYLTYRERCSCAWLVLMTQVGKGLGTNGKFSTDVWNHRYETLFDQVWIFQNHDSARKLEVVKHNSKQDRL